MVISALLLKIHLLHQSATEIENAFADRLVTDTNTLIGISGRDRYMRRLADTINIQFRRLRAEHHKYHQGDLDLKEAVTNMSHDLRTPLTAICGYLDLLEQEDKSETAKRYIEIIRNRSELMLLLTEELFCYSVSCSTENDMAVRSVTVNHVLEESIATFYTDLKSRNITPEIHMPKAKVVRMLDASALSRVFSNLMNNATKYSGGDLGIVLHKTWEIIFSNMAAWLIEVQVGKLFDRFLTVEAARKSTGLGLAISRALVERMNESIAAEYEDGRLSIRICFPGQL